jgi:hypothetical protein
MLQSIRCRVLECEQLTGRIGIVVKVLPIAAV